MTNFVIAQEFNGELWVRADEFHKGIKKAVEAEREACALICDSHADDPVYCGELIRARGQA